MHAAVIFRDNFLELFDKLPSLSSCMDYPVAEQIVGGACVTLNVLEIYVRGG